MRSWLGITLIATATSLGSLAAHAAQYKWIGADGRVNYSDRQPPQDAQLLDTRAAGSADGDASLPYALRQASSKYPVVLYTSQNCEPCGAAREHLIKRGVPFAEYTLRTKADADAYQRAGFDGKTVPGIRVGRQISSGYDPSGVNALLDAAGYPKSARLPAQYVRPAPRPLAADGGAGRSATTTAGASPASDSPPSSLASSPSPSALGDGSIREAAPLGAAGPGNAPSSRAASNPAPVPEPVPAAGANPNFRF